MENTNSVHLSEIGQIALSVQNVPAARDFYRDVLGMQLQFEGGGMAFFQCGTIRLMLGTSENRASGDGALLYFRVADLLEVHLALKTRGVNFVQEPHLVARMKSHDLWIAFLKDPDGNTLGLMSEVARQEP